VRAIITDEIRLCPRIDRRPKCRFAGRGFEAGWMQDAFPGQGLSEATTKRPACTEKDGFDHYKGYRLGVYLVYGFLCRCATVGLLQHLCES